jgi:large subunit ribosomal protein L17
MKGRKLGRNASHRRAMFRNMASSLICSVAVDEDDPQAPKVPGRIVTTLAKAKELRPFVERLVTMARKSLVHAERAAEFEVTVDRNTEAWKSWRESETWNKWNQAIAPAVAYRRRAFALLRNKDAVEILFSELAERFQDRPGGYTRVVRLADVRLGDAGEQALIEFVGERDRVASRRAAPMVVEDDEDEVESADDEAAGEEAPEAEAAESETAETSADESTDEEEKTKD